MRSWLRTHYIALIVTAGVLVSFVVQRTDTVKRQTIERTGSIERSIQTCDRGNPGRAYLQIRADEFTVSTTRSKSYTTRVAPAQWAILDCEKTVAQGGKPIPLPAAIQEQYIALYRHGEIGTVLHGRITSSVPFREYFDTP